MDPARARVSRHRHRADTNRASTMRRTAAALPKPLQCAEPLPALPQPLLSLTPRDRGRGGRGSFARGADGMILTEEDILFCAKNLLRRIMGSSSESGISLLSGISLVREPGGVIHDQVLLFLCQFQLACNGCQHVRRCPAIVFRRLGRLSVRCAPVQEGCRKAARRRGKRGCSKRQRRRRRNVRRRALNATPAAHPTWWGRRGRETRKRKKLLTSWRLAGGSAGCCRPPGANLQQQQPQRPSRAATGWGHPSRRLLPKRAVSRLWISEAQAPMQACPRQ